MNPIEDLILKQIDQGLSPAEQAELEAALANDEGARRLLAMHLELEAGLRGTGRVPDVSGPTVRHIHQTCQADLERSVMRTIATLPIPTSHHRRKTLVFVILASAAAVLLAVAAWSWLPQAPMPATDHWAILVESSADVLVEGQPKEAATPLRLAGEATVRTQADEGFALIQYADGSRIELFGNTAARLKRDSGGKRVQLLTGSLRADVRPQPAGQPLVMQTRHAELRMADTRLGISAEDDEGTRVHLESGQVELRRGQEPATYLEPGATVFVSTDENAPAIIAERQSILTQPDREVTFPGLRALLFAPDGQGIVGFTSRQAVLWQPQADRLEATPLGGEVRKSYDIPVWSGSMLALLQPAVQRLELWDLAQRKSAYMGMNPEPRFPLATVSPRGDWWAYWIAGKTGVRLARPAPAESIDVQYAGKLSCIAASPDGRLLAVGRLEGKSFVADVLDAATGQMTARLPLDRPGPRKAPLSFSFSADGNRLAVALVGRIQVWDVSARQPLAVIDHPLTAILQLTLSADGKSVAAAAQDDWTWIWPVDRPTEPLGIQVGQAARGLAFAPDGRSLAILDKTSRITLWNLPE